MLWRQRLLPALVLGLLALGCARTTPVDTANDERAIDAVRDREISALSSGVADSLVAVVTTDAVIMPPNEPILTGADAIRTWYQNTVREFSAEGRYTNAEVTIAGDWAIERYDGVMRLTPRAGGAPMEQQMKGIHVYRRQPDGTWRIAQDIWNANAPQPVTTPK